VHLCTAATLGRVQIQNSKVKTQKWIYVLQPRWGEFKFKIQKSKPKSGFMCCSHVGESSNSKFKSQNPKVDLCVAATLGRVQIQNSKVKTQKWIYVLQPGWGALLLSS
jgi:hypothetical protein